MTGAAGGHIWPCGAPEAEFPRSGAMSAGASLPPRAGQR